MQINKSFLFCKKGTIHKTSDLHEEQKTGLQETPNFISNELFELPK